MESNELSGAGAGLPFGPVQVVNSPSSGAAIDLIAPVAVQTQTDDSASPPLDYQQPDGPANVPPGSDTGFGIGPFSVTSAAGSAVNLSIDTTPAFSTGTHPLATGNGLVLTMDGTTDNPMTVDGVVAGPLQLDCNPPVSAGAGPSIGTIPVVSPVTFGPMTVMQNGNTVTFTAHLSSTPVPSPTYQWQVSTDGGQTWSNDTTDAGNTTSSLTVDLSGATNGDQYRIVGTNTINNPSSTPSGPFVVSTAISSPTFAPPSPPVIIDNPTSATVTAGQTATFSAAATGNPAPTVQWQVSTDGGATWSNDTTDAGNTTGTLSVATTAGSTSLSGNEYRAVFTISAGTATTPPATLTVVLPPNFPAVTAVMPSHGSAFSVVLIRGRNLAHASAVSFGSAAATVFLRLNSQLILALAPTSSTGGTVDVTVTTPVGRSQTSAADDFTYGSG
jgi:hypothetical protein